MSNGIVNTLRRMGHQVLPGELPATGGNIPPQVFESIKESLPTIEALKGCDAVLVSGPEHIAPWLDAVYGKYEWKQLGVPKASWWHETLQREDYSLDWDNVSFWADENFVPAAQDADWLDQEMFGKGHVHWLPFGVDTGVFHPQECSYCTPEAIEIAGHFRGMSLDEMRNPTKHCKVCSGSGFVVTQKKWPIAFVGLVYEKRARFLQALGRHHHPPIRVGNVSVQDLSGYCAEESVHRMVDNYRRVGVFFNLPAMSSLLVTKVYEVMACGTFLLTPELSADRGISKNMELFESDRHLVYYRSSNLPYVAQLLRDWSSEEKVEEREKIAMAGWREVHGKHSLDKRLAVILEKIGVKETVQ
jgi:hypothetical protein